MEAHSDWYNRTVKVINLHKDTFSKKDSKKYKLDLLLRLVRRVDDFSATCGECQMFQPEITKLAEGLYYTFNMPKEESKSYSTTINNITKHLQKQHKLVKEGQYMGIGIAIGIGIGAAFGAIFENPSAGTAIGIAIGVAIGKYMDNKAKKGDKVI